MPDFTPGTRVIHTNAALSYGPGELLEVIRPLLSCRPPSMARVQFDGTAVARTVCLDNLTAEPERRVIWQPPRILEPGVYSDGVA